MAKKQSKKAKPPKKKPRQAEGMAKSGRLTAAVIATHFEVTPYTVRGWFARGCPWNTFKAIATWRANNIRSEHASPDKRPGGGPNGKGPHQPTLAEKRLASDIRRIDADIRHKELRNEKEAGDLISLATAMREGAELVARLVDRLGSFPDEMENCFPSETRAMNKSDFAEKIRMLRLEISRWDLLGTAADDIILAVAKRIEAERARDQAG